jgi:hypothetical protein
LHALLLFFVLVDFLHPRDHIFNKHTAILIAEEGFQNDNRRIFDYDCFSIFF